MALPAGVFVPDQFGQPAGERDQVGPAVVIEIGDHHLIAAFEIGGDGVLYETRGRRGGQQGEGEQESEQTAHAPQYTCSITRYENGCCCSDGGGRRGVGPSPLT